MKKLHSLSKIYSIYEEDLENFSNEIDVDTYFEQTIFVTFLNLITG